MTFPGRLNRPLGVDLRFSLPKIVARFRWTSSRRILRGMFLNRRADDRGPKWNASFGRFRFRGKPFRRTVVGPLADLKPGENVLIVDARTLRLAKNWARNALQNLLHGWAWLLATCPDADVRDGDRAS